MAIQVLPAELAAKIAAGEVIERPASVVKELLENAIDAGARSIRVEIREGGIRLIRLTDDGCGISAAETEMAFLRHATSKLQTADDLERIATLGFRGEALASIAAVSQVMLITRTVDEPVGTRLRLEAGQVTYKGAHGAPVGTSITVENLFYNVPARRKFLRQPATEAAHIQTLVSRYALAWPKLHLTLERDGRLAFQSTGGEVMDILLKLYDLETVRQLIAFRRQEGGMTVWGHTSLPNVTRSGRSQLNVFVNRRYVQDRLLSRAILEAYHGLLPSGRFPFTVLLVDLDPGDVDVNVHPTKSEVRFRRAGDVFTAVQKAVRAALSQAGPVRPLDALSLVAQSPAPQPPGQARFAWDERAQPVWGHRALELQRTADAPIDQDVGRGEVQPSSPGAQRNLPPLRVLGQLSQTFIIAEGPGGLYLIDQHTAHERVLYERFWAEKQRQSVAQQGLLAPLSVDLAPVQVAALLEKRDMVATLGFAVEPFGGETILVRSIPAMLSPHAVGETLAELAEVLAGGGDGERLFENALLTVVCHSAVRAGQTLSHDEMRDLIRQLEQTALPHSCPHGRPIFLHLSTERLASAFGRR